MLLLIGLGSLLSCSRLSAPDGAGDSIVEGDGDDGDGGNGGNGGGPFVEGTLVSHPAAFLTSVVPGKDRLLVRWQTDDLDLAEVDLAILLASDEDSLSNATPLTFASDADSLLIEGLDEGTPYFLSIGVRDASSASPFAGTLDYRLSGPVVRVRTSQPIYANPAADAATADGLTPETAWPNLFLAILTAFVSGGGQGGVVWVSEGTFTDSSSAVLAGVDLYGGFDTAFALEDRDPRTRPTHLKGLAGEGVLRIESGGPAQTVDGFHIDGLGLASTGLDIDTTSVSIRGVEVRACSRGVRARAAHAAEVTSLSMTDCVFESNLVQGASFDGPFDIAAEACEFRGNGQEGLDIAPLVAPAGETVELLIRDCRFLGNGAEGIDVELLAPSGSVGPGGLFRVTIEDSEFEQNQLAGFYIDIDYEESPAWRSEITVRGCTTRANGTNGGALDIDAASSCLLHRVLSTANNGDGIAITSESAAGMVVLSSCVLAANLGVGVRSSIGNVGVAVSHCVLAGNAEGGIIAESVGATTNSTIAHLQVAPFAGTRSIASQLMDASPIPFQYAPIEYRTISAASDTSWLLDEQPSFGVGVLCEVAADSIARTAVAVGVESVELAPSPIEPPLPTRLAVFPELESVVENYELRESSAGIAAGMRLPNGEPVDLGLYGWQDGGSAGGEELHSTELFSVASTTPAWGQSMQANADLHVSFRGGSPDQRSIAGGLRLVDAGGAELALNASEEDGELVISAPVGGWQGGEILEMHPTLTSVDGALPLVPVALPIGAF